MFRKFEEKENVSSTSQLKSSVQRQIRADIIKQMPLIEEYMQEIWPKKENAKMLKCHDHIEILSIQDNCVFFKHRNGPWHPALRLLHKYPFILPKQQVDRGAIKFVLSGANIMCPGLTSPGAKLTPEVQAESVVAVMAEGKEHALAVGLMKMSTEDIIKINKNVGVENIHYLNDGLWHLKCGG